MSPDWGAIRGHSGVLLLAMILLWVDLDATEYIVIWSLQHPG